MNSQQLVWTVLPQGLSADRKRATVSVLVSPRLERPASFPAELTFFDHWINWPGVVSNASFTVVANGTKRLPATLISNPSTSVWEQIFPNTTYVRPWIFDSSEISNRAILSYNLALTENVIARLYGEVGTQAGLDLPERRNLGDRINGGRGAQGILGEPRHPADTFDILRDQRIGSSGRPYPIKDDEDETFNLLRAYHTPLQQPEVGKTPQNAPMPKNYPGGFDHPLRHVTWDTYRRSTLPQSDDLRDTIDFHRIVASLAQFPELNRLCGLLLDLEIDRPEPSGPPVSLELEADWAGLVQSPVETKDDVYPKTMVNNEGEIFEVAARSSTTPVVRRHLKLTDPRFSLVRMDVDGAGMKLNNFSENLRRPLPSLYTDDSFSEDEEEKAGLPSLRTAGFALAETRRDLTLSSNFEDARTAHQDLTTNQTAPTLYVENTTRGYRVDVWDDSSRRWHSLFQRLTRHQLLNSGNLLPPAPQDAFTEEGMARIGAGKSIDGSNPDILKMHEALVTWTGWSLSAPEPWPNLITSADNDATAAEDEQVPTGLPLKTDHKVVPGSLPRLRFGRSYRMRARLVDLAGESVPFDAGDNQPKGAVSAEKAYLRYEPVEPPALALERSGGVVSFPAEGESLGVVCIRSYNDTPDKNDDPTTEVVLRHVVPTRVTQRFAEQHGVLDTGPGGRLDPSTYSMLASMDQPLDAVVHTRAKSSGQMMDETYPVREPGDAMRYLPDPLAVGVAVRITGLPGIDPTTPYVISLFPDGGSWPNAKPFVLRLAEGSGSPVLEAGADLRFTIFAGKAERVRVYLSSLLSDEAPDLMAVTEMISQHGGVSTTKLNAIKKNARAGQHWMYTPPRLVTLVHAVQKPLVTPDLELLSVSRVLNSLDALTTVRTPLHAKSTARLETFGGWSEPSDDPLADPDGPSSVALAARAFKKDIARDDAPNGTYALQGSHTFRSTAYRRVIYRTDATTRFPQFFPKTLRDTEGALKVSSPEQRRWVPNAAPPPPPDVVYVIPTFGWVRNNTVERTSSLRIGGGLRVYLNRPWMSTGFTEMLGVVLPNADATSLRGRAGSSALSSSAGSVTMWGLDPLFADAKITSASPQRGDFPLASMQGPIAFEGTNLPVEEGTDLPPGDFKTNNLPHPEGREDLTLSVAPHQVGFDPQRKLWYADIAIRPPTDTYMPFVRLALARYNPVSVHGAHLSPIVVTEFQQLTPDRMVVTTREPGSNTVHVSLYGTDPNRPRSPRLTEYEAITEVLPKAGDPDLDWVEQAAPDEGRGILRARTAKRSTSQVLRSARRERSEAEAALSRGDLDFVRARPERILALAPPLLWETTIQLPNKPSEGKRRITVMEREVYGREPDDVGNQRGDAIGTRIVFLETVEID